MAEAKKVKEEKQAEVKEAESTPLQGILATVNLDDDKIGKLDKKKQEKAEQDRDQFLKMIGTFIEEVAKADESAAPAVDKALINNRIKEIDTILSNQVNEILHQPEFQELESTWRSIYFLVDNTSWEDDNVDIQLLDASKDELINDFGDKPVTQSGLAIHLFEKEYDQAGGEPFSAIVSDFELTNSNDDIELLEKITTAGSLVHAPFLSSIGHEFFGLDHLSELTERDLRDYFDGSNPDYTQYLNFRETEVSRFSSLTMNRFLLRAPYEPNKRSSFEFKEDASGKNARKYLWGSPAFLMAKNMVQAFQKNGWAVDIVGLKGGGLTKGLAQISIDDTIEERTHSTEVLIPDHHEIRYSDNGITPLMGIKGEPKAFFYSAHSTQDPGHYEDPEDQATAVVMANLPYIFLASRLAHYLRVQQRDNIGGGKQRDQIESELQDWLNKLVNKNPNPRPEEIAKQPLKDATVEVTPIVGQPGWYNIDMMIAPHLKIEGVKLSLALVANIPQDGS